MDCILNSLSVGEKIMEYIDRSGEKPGAPLPHQKALCTELQANPDYMQCALQWLVAHGILDCSQDQSYYLPKPRIRIDMLDFYDLKRIAMQNGLVYSRKVLEADLRFPGIRIAHLMGMKEGSKAYVIKRLALFDGKAEAIVESYLPADCCKGLLQYDFSKASVFEILKKHYQIVLESQSVEVNMIASSPWESAMLDIGHGSPLVEFQCYSNNQFGKLAEYCVVKANALRCEILAN